MFDKWLNVPAHLYLKLTALTILTVGIALSNVLMSIGAIWIIANWLIQGDFKDYWKRFKKAPSAWLVVFIFFFLMVSLIWSDDFQYGFKDLRVKLPFIVIPLVLATSQPLKKEHVQFLLFVFLGIMLYTSLYNFIRFNFILEQPQDIRDMSVFISHVRYAVLINFAWVTAISLMNRKNAVWLNVVLLLFTGWMFFYLYKSQVINGYLLFILLVGIFILISASRIRNAWRKRSVFAGLVLGVFLLGFFANQKWNALNNVEKIQFSELELYTPNGNPYYHDTLSGQIENGHFVWLYVSQEEMKTQWEKRSKIPYDSLDHKGQPMFGTLMRFLTSKGLRKDSMGVMSLTNAEIQFVENGQTSIRTNAGFSSRLEAFVMEYEIYKDGGDPNGNSFNQRIEHLKAARHIIEKEWLFGVGVGDVPESFERAYDQMSSLLKVENRHRSHNQFLTIWVALGIIGAMAFLVLFIVPFFEMNQRDNLLILFVLGLFFSCLFQDFIETQAGVTIFGLFYGLALYREKET
jgi:O-antigen ligase